MSDVPNPPTKDEKLDSVITTLTILLPRLTESYHRDVVHCIKYLKEIREELRDESSRTI
jgi:hypothetical protein